MSDLGTPVRVARGIVAGAIAGSVASFAMDRFQAATSSLLPSGGSNDDPVTSIPRRIS